MTIRDATPNDLPVLIDFQRRMAIETENLNLDIPALTNGAKEVFKDPSKGKYYVAEQNGEVIGCLMTTFEWSEWRNGNVIWIQSVYIDEKFRGQGVFTKLYAHVQTLVNRDPNLKGIRLYVDKKNEEAQRVYRKLGMNGEHYMVYEWMKG
jgi:ribosomal protein S18 acetylase RimI-like enzyme